MENNKIGHIINFISDNSEMSDDEIKNELRNEGVDVASFKNRVMKTVRNEIQAKLKERAATKVEAKKNVNKNIVEKVNSWSKNKCIEVFTAIKNGGGYSSNQRKIALAFRNQNDKEMSDPELRSCLIDVLTLDEKNER